MAIENFFTGTQNLNLAVGPTFAKVAEFPIGDGAATSFQIADNSVKYVFALIVHDDDGVVTLDYDTSWSNGFFTITFDSAPSVDQYTGVVLYSEASDTTWFAEGQ